MTIDRRSAVELVAGDDFDEFAEGLRADFFEERGAAHFDGAFADSEGGGDAFVGVSLLEEFDDFPVLAREAVDAGLEGFVLGEFLKALAFEVESLSDGFEEGGGGEGFLQELDGSEFEGLDGEGDVGVGGHDDDGEFDFAPADFPDEIDAGHVGESDIEDEASAAGEGEGVEEAGRGAVNASIE